MLKDYIFQHLFSSVLTVIYTVIFVIGFLGNVMVCRAVYTNQPMRTASNFIIVNLAVVDLIVISISLPLTFMWELTETWHFGETICYTVRYLQLSSGIVSSLTQLYIFVDHWQAIRFPLRHKCTTSRAKITMLIIWLIAMSASFLELMVRRGQSKIDHQFKMQYFMQCTSTWSEESEHKWTAAKALFLWMQLLQLEDSSAALEDSSVD